MKIRLGQLRARVHLMMIYKQRRLARFYVRDYLCKYHSRKIVNSDFGNCKQEYNFLLKLVCK